VTANPVVGQVSDWVVAQGGTVILAETTEMIGTLHLLRARALNPQVAEAIESMISKNEDLMRRMLGEQAHLAVTPGNMDGGLSTIMEKSLGCIAKGGNGVIEEVVPYAQTPDRRGLVLMDTPGYDVESFGGLVGAGCQVILFTTGRGSPIGAPLVPTIKVASNSELWQRMREDLDINAGEIADGGRSIGEMSQHLMDCLAGVLNGRLTRAEENHQEVMEISMTMEAG
jgi:altronate dehydratase large subunit